MVHGNAIKDVEEEVEGLEVAVEEDLVVEEDVAASEVVVGLEVET